MAPLHIASQSGYVAICQRLMEGGARIDFLTTSGKSSVRICSALNLIFKTILQITFFEIFSE
jgi:hypothetical protein